jgi:hypothetical protein
MTFYSLYSCEIYKITKLLKKKKIFHNLWVWWTTAGSSGDPWAIGPTPLQLKINWRGSWCDSRWVTKRHSSNFFFFIKKMEYLENFSKSPLVFNRKSQRMYDIINFLKLDTLNWKFLNLKRIIIKVIKV